MEQVNFGEKIKMLREAKGISQRQLAIRLDITPTYMSKIERGEFQPPSEEVVKKMAKYLNYDSDLLLSLADKVDSEILKIIKGNPQKYCALLKTKDDAMNNDWRKYNQACKQLVVAFLKRYYPEESLDTVYFIGAEQYTGVFECCDRFYDIDFVQKCLKLDATFEDMDSYKDYCLECSFHDREVGISFETWVKYPEKRKPFKEQPFTTEGQLRPLLEKCIPALEGITHYEDLLKEIEEKFLPPF